jgi:AraC-like DNA-binding protein
MFNINAFIFIQQSSPDSQIRSSRRHTWPHFHLQVRARGTDPLQVANPDHLDIRVGEDIEISCVIDDLTVTLSVEAAYLNYLHDSPYFRCPQAAPRDPFITDIMRQLCEEVETSFCGEKMYMEGLIVSFLLHLGATYGHQHKKVFAPKGKLSAGQLKNVATFTRNAIRTNINLSMLASAANLSPFHFSRVFRNTMGRSPYQYVLQRKIEYAQKMMHQKEKSLSDIAFSLNFTDQAHFSNTFKRITGVCPKEFLEGQTAAR